VSTTATTGTWACIAIRGGYVVSGRIRHRLPTSGNIFNSRDEMLAGCFDAKSARWVPIVNRRELRGAASRK
jgi:hypothetical protein